MKNLPIRWLGLLLGCGWGLVGQPARPAHAQAALAGRRTQTYDFLRRYFAQIASASSSDYRLDARLLPVVSSYAYRPDLRQLLSIKYINENQFLTSIAVDTILSVADIAAMQRQLQVWQQVRRWPVAALRRQHIQVLRHDRRNENEVLLPHFTTYQVFPPLFSLSGRVALFYVENYCGLDCAGGQLNLFRRQGDGSWKFVLGVPTFVN